MRVEYHPRAEQEVADAARFYDSISRSLGTDFLAEFRRSVAMATTNPGRFHLIKPGFRRANLEAIPLSFYLSRSA